jgi:hypothetical protein
MPRARAHQPQPQAADPKNQPFSSWGWWQGRAKKNKRSPPQERTEKLRNKTAGGREAKKMTARAGFCGGIDSHKHHDRHGNRVAGGCLAWVLVGLAAGFFFDRPHYLPFMPEHPIMDLCGGGCRAEGGKYPYEFKTKYNEIDKLKKS